MHPKFDQYRARFMSLNKIELVQFQNDTVVFPKESEHFQDMDENGMLLAWKENEKGRDEFMTEFNGELHKGIKENDHGKIAKYLNEISEMGSKVTAETMQKLECRNAKGQTPILLAAELD